MKMNKKGFTLIELLAVVVIIAMISMIAIPNIVGLTDGIRQDEMLDDAKKLISLAKYQVTTNYDIRNFQDENRCDYEEKSCVLFFSDLNANGDIIQDPDSTNGTNYLGGSVKYTNNGTAEYCVYLEGSKRKIGNSINECVKESDLYSRSNVHDK